MSTVGVSIRASIIAASLGAPVSGYAHVRELHVEGIAVSNNVSAESSSVRDMDVIVSATGAVRREFVPKTKLARKLYEIQRRIVASGVGLASTEEIEKELDESRM